MLANFSYVISVAAKRQRDGSALNIRSCDTFVIPLQPRRNSDVIKSKSTLRCFYLDQPICRHVSCVAGIGSVAMTTAAHVLVNHQNKSDKSASGRRTEAETEVKEHYRHPSVRMRNYREGTSEPFILILK